MERKSPKIDAATHVVYKLRLRDRFVAIIDIGIARVDPPNKPIEMRSIVSCILGLVQ
jgi:hypothetical protein